MSEKRSNESVPGDESLREELSAFMDGELDADRARFLQQRLRHDTELRVRWERWQLQSSAMRRQAQPLPVDFADRVASVLDADAVNAVPVRSRTLRWAGGAALAASLAVAGVFVFDASHRPWAGASSSIASVRPATQPAASVAASSQPTATVQRAAVVVPEPTITSPRLETARIELPIPVHDGVVGAFRSPLRPVLARHRQPRPEFSPFPQPFVIDPELEAYLEQQKTGGTRDPFLRRAPQAQPAQDDSVRAVSYPQGDGH